MTLLMLPSAVGLPSGSRVWLAAGVTDMRAGFNSLAAKVQTVSASPKSVMYAREGVELDRSLLAKWVGHAATRKRLGWAVRPFACA